MRPLQREKARRRRNGVAGWQVWKVWNATAMILEPGVEWQTRKGVILRVGQLFKLWRRTRKVDNLGRGDSSFSSQRRERYCGGDAPSSLGEGKTRSSSPCVSILALCQSEQITFHDKFEHSRLQYVCYFLCIFWCNCCVSSKWKHRSLARLRPSCRVLFVWMRLCNVILLLYRCGLSFVLLRNRFIGIWLIETFAFL